MIRSFSFRSRVTSASTRASGAAPSFAFLAVAAVLRFAGARFAVAPRPVPVRLDAARPERLVAAALRERLADAEAGFAEADRPLPDAVREELAFAPAVFAALARPRGAGVAFADFPAAPPREPDAARAVEARLVEARDVDFAPAELRVGRFAPAVPPPGAVSEAADGAAA